MLKLASDADVHGAIADRFLEMGSVDIVRIVDVLPEGTDDPAILGWAAAEGRILLTNDRSTMIGYAIARVRSGRPMAGLIVMPPHHWVGKAIYDALLIAEVCEPEELRDQVVYLPLRPGSLRASSRASQEDESTQID